MSGLGSGVRWPANGFTREEAHGIVGTKSLKDWVEKGGNLHDAVAMIEARHRELGKKLL